LIVLDIKWTRKHKDIPSNIHAIQKVHLVSPPSASHFWRWHNAGQGCLSTIEAIYFAAMEYTAGAAAAAASSSERWTIDANRKRLIYIMWLFSLQYATINKRCMEENRSFTPFSEEGKDYARQLRQQLAVLGETKAKTRLKGTKGIPRTE
jgi:hypothetical protein